MSAASTPPPSESGEDQPTPIDRFPRIPLNEFHHDNTTQDEPDQSPSTSPPGSLGSEEYKVNHPAMVQEEKCDEVIVQSTPVDNGVSIPMNNEQQPGNNTKDAPESFSTAPTHLESKVYAVNIMAIDEIIIKQPAEQPIGSCSEREEDMTERQVDIVADLYNELYEEACEPEVYSPACCETCADTCCESCSINPCPSFFTCGENEAKLKDKMTAVLHKARNMGWKKFSHIILLLTPDIVRDIWVLLELITVIIGLALSIASL